MRWFVKVREGFQHPLLSFLHTSDAFAKAFVVIIHSLFIIGKDTALGAVAAAVSVKWKALTEDERAYYEKLASDDKERYEREKAVRDEEYLRELDERRKKNSVIETETRMRGSTIQQTDRVTSEFIDKKSRALTQKEKDRLEENKRVKDADAKIRNQQLAELKKAKAEQAEARLKYLLSQSDIFGHFGVSKKPDDDKKPQSKADRRAAAAADELDEDEKAMLDEENDEGESADTKHENTVLLQQPSWVSGGQMRSYQLEGLNWMIRLHENGINGILADEMGNELRVL